MSLHKIDPSKFRKEVEALAHSYWEAEGRPEGKAEEHWLRAERTLQMRVNRVTPGTEAKPGIAAAATPRTRATRQAARR